MKILFKVLITLAFYLPLASQAEDFLPTIETITERGTLRVAMHANDQHYMFFTDAMGVLEGFEVNIAEYFADKLGVELAYIRTADTFDGVVDQLARGEADIAISLLTPNLTRAKKVYFSDPYVYLDKLLAYNVLTAARFRLRDPANAIHSIQGVALGVIDSSSYVTYAKQYFPLATIKTYPTATDAIQAVEAGEIFGFFGSSTNIPPVLEADPTLLLHIGVSQLQGAVDPIAVAVSPYAPDLLTWINLALELRRLAGIEESLPDTGLKIEESL